MASNDRKPSAFTQASARRVVRAVRLVERGSRDIHAPPLRTAMDDGGTNVRLGRIIGAWPIGQSREVTLISEARTVNAMNHFCSIPGQCPYERYVVVFEDGGEWYLLNAQCGSE